MKTSTILWILVALVVILGGWYWFAMSTPASNQTNTVPTQNIITLGENTASSTPYLTASNGMTLYMFDKDSMGTTTCYGGCSQKWPPYVVAPNATVQPPTGSSAQVATLSRLDGGQQVTYNGMPLYFFVEDKATGDTKGDGLNKVWHIVKP